MLPPRAVAPRGRRGCVPRGGARAVRLARRAGRRLGARRRPRSRPCRGIAQLVLAPCDEEDAEQRAYRARRRAELVDGVYVASLSFRTVTYKALCAATQLAGFYLDLRDERWARRSRSSTSDSRRTPSRAGSAPNRSACSATTARSTPSRATPHGWRRASGRAASTRASRRRSIAEAPTPRSSTTPSSCSSAPASTSRRRSRGSSRPHGRTTPGSTRRSAQCAATTRWRSSPGTVLPGSSSPTASPAGRSSTGTACARSAWRSATTGLGRRLLGGGRCSAPRGRRRPQGAPGAGSAPLHRPRHGLRLDAELTRELAARRPYAGLGLGEHRLRRDRRVARRAGGRSRRARHALHGYTREELSLMLRPIAQSGRDPVYSMGDDAPIAPLAGRARPLASYFRQRFAQVTNPAIDHYRERTVMSVATLVGPRPAIDAEGPLAPLVSLPSFLVTPRGLAALEPAWVDATFDADEGLGRAVERIADACAALVEQGATVLCLTDDAAGGDRASIPSSLAVSAAHDRLVERALRLGASLASCRATTRATATWSRRWSDMAQTSSARGSRSRPSPTSRRTTRSATTAPHRRRRSSGCSARSRTESSRSMSKMGISERRELPGRRLFEAVGLDRRLCRRFFGGTPSAIGGIGRDRLEREALTALRPPGRQADWRTPASTSSARAATARDRPRRRRGAAGGRHRRACAREGP